MDIKELSVNTIRILSAEEIEKAHSGHPGLPLGAAPMAYTLWADVMKHNPKDPTWFNRDRFILSAGHGSAMLYSLLHLFGYGLEIDDLKNFRQLNSLTPGHPEYGHTPGVEATTGPLGQGLSMAVGMALAEANLAARFNKEDLKPIDHYTYVIAGDGCMMEGITNEASSLAGHLGLSKLIVLYDSNNITIEGRTDLAFTENVRGRYEALGWDTSLVEDGNDLGAIRDAIEEAKKTDKPSLIEVKTKIGYASLQEDTAKAHGSPLGEESLKALKKNLNWEYEEDFFVPDEVKSHMEDLRKEASLEQKKDEDILAKYKEEYPSDYKELMAMADGDIDPSYLESEDYYDMAEEKATRASSGEVINKLSGRLPSLIGGSADLGPSNKTHMENREDLTADNLAGTNIHFGVREHAMAAISNGLALHGGLIPYCASFLIFSDYLKPALRLSALMKQRVIYVLTHDSIGVGEDGPTHQPIEQLAMLRSIPGLTVFRPADGRETAAAWAYALKKQDGPTAIALTRQATAKLDETCDKALRGAYVVRDFGENIDMAIIATGSELALAYQAGEKLKEDGINIRLISMPSMDVFDRQDESYKEEVLPDKIDKRMSIEAASSFGWHKYLKGGYAFSIDKFGSSAPGKEVFEDYGFTVDKVVSKVKDLLAK